MKWLEIRIGHVWVCSRETFRNNIREERDLLATASKQVDENERRREVWIRQETLGSAFLSPSVYDLG